ncbi:MAG: YecH family protein [Acidobacteriota bacterium]|nr:MAG: YecH family protein [Acidobacteriota bacterium]
MNSNSIHAHSVLEIILSAGGPIPRETLVQTIESKFGADARFHSCSRDGMTINETLDFLLAKRKTVETGGQLQPGPEGPCNHG